MKAVEKEVFDLCRESLDEDMFLCDFLFFFFLKKFRGSENSSIFRVPMDPEFAIIHSKLTMY